MTNRKIAPYFRLELDEIEYFVIRDSTDSPSNWMRKHDGGQCIEYNLDPAKYVAIKQQVNKINRFYKPEAEERLTQLVEGLAKRLKEPTGPNPSELNNPRKWMK